MSILLPFFEGKKVQINSLIVLQINFITPPYEEVLSDSIMSLKYPKGKEIPSVHRKLM